MSQTTKHTPGPWYERHGQISSEVSSHGCTIANCNRTSKGISDSEIQANARLIAAAPEMYEALQRLLGCCELNLDDMEQETRQAIQYAVDIVTPIEETEIDMMMKKETA